SALQVPRGCPRRPRGPRPTAARPPGRAAPGGPAPGEPRFRTTRVRWPTTPPPPAPPPKSGEDPPGGTAPPPPHLVPVDAANPGGNGTTVLFPSRTMVLTIVVGGALARAATSPRGGQGRPIRQPAAAGVAPGRRAEPEGTGGPRRGEGSGDADAETTPAGT